MNDAFTDNSLDTRSYTFGAIALHALGPVLCFVFALCVVPRFAAVFSEMIDGNTALPVLTQKVLDISSHMQTWWYAYLIMLVLLLTLDAVLYRRLSAASQAGAQVWSVLALLTGGAAVMLLIVAMFLPVARMITNVAE